MSDKVNKLKLTEIKEDIIHTRNIRIISKINKTTQIRSFTVQHKKWWGWSSDFGELGKLTSTDWNDVKAFINQVDKYDTARAK